VKKGELSKLLGAPFGLKLDVKEIDEFLVKKIHKQQNIWSTLHLSLARKVILVDSTLASTLWFFISV
jgi:hypothetical protein